MTVLRFFLPLAAANTAANHVNRGGCAATDTEQRPSSGHGWMPLDDLPKATDLKVRG